MLRYLSDYKRESVLAPLFKMLEATFDLFVPLVMADIVNVGIAAHDFHYILVRCGILLLLAIVGLACSLTAQYFSAKAAVGYSTGLRHALFEHIQTLSFSEMDTMGTSTLITRMTSDLNQVQSGLNLFLRLFLRSPFVVIGAMIMAFTVNFRAALIFVVAIPLLSVVVFGVMVITRPLYKSVQTRLDRVLGLTRENLTGVRVVRAFDKERQCDVMGSGRIGNEFRLYVDRPNSHEAWDIELFYKQQLCGQVRSAGRPEKFTGAVRSGLEFRLVIGDSPLFQRITLAPGSRRLDFETRIDWREARKLLRVTFPVDAFSEEASYDIPYGYLRRPVHTNTSWDMARFEVAGQRYADLSDARGGAALLNDCKYGYSAEPGALSLTLLRSPKYPDWDADLGIQEFTYSFLPHRGTLTESEVMDEAARLNRPPLALPGFAGELCAPVTVEPGDVSFTVLKKAEKEECRVIRLVETAGRFSKARLHTEAELVETDLLEWNDGAHLKPTGGSIELEFRPFQIRTFKLRGE